jgi:NAD(P)-dependent dehydrogenase (short-subunit alcohol dehydrogenase family)
LKRPFAFGQPLRILVNSAGIMACPLARDSQGYESQFATNLAVRVQEFTLGRHTNGKDLVGYQLNRGTFWRDALEASIQESWFREPLQSCDCAPVEAMSALKAAFWLPGL